MDTAHPDGRLRRRVRDGVVAFAVFLALYALGSYGFPPGYFLIAGADAVQAALPPVSFDVVLLALCGCLAVASVFVADRTSDRDGATDVRWWATGVGGALAVLGMLALGFALTFFVGGAGVAPVAIASATGLALLVASRWVLAR